MAFEVALRRGELRTSDARATYGVAFRSLQFVDVMVLDASSGPPATARVLLVDVRAGHRLHRVFACPGCHGPRHVLLAKEGTLRCGRCVGARTRRQLERTRADWNRRGGQAEDELMRLLDSKRRMTLGRLARAIELERALVAADIGRYAEIACRVAKLLTAAKAHP